MSLRRFQFKLAQRSAAMAIFLGKNYLGQSDARHGQLSTASAQPSETRHKPFSEPGTIAGILDTLIEIGVLPPLAIPTNVEDKSPGQG